jgi:hypothetical protein
MRININGKNTKKILEYSEGTIKVTLFILSYFTS